MIVFVVVVVIAIVVIVIGILLDWFTIVDVV